MPRRCESTFAAWIAVGAVVTAAVGFAQAPTNQTPSAIPQQLFGNRAVSCRVTSALELEVEFLDKSKSRINVPPPAPAPTPPPTAAPPAAGRGAPPPPNSFLAALTAAMATTPPTSASPLIRGFDENGQPFTEQRLADGSRRRRQLGGVTVTKADGTREFIPATSADSVPIGTPPDLAADPMRGRAWVEAQNSAMLEVISSLMLDSPREMAKFHVGEDRATDGDVLAHLSYRATVARFLASKPSQ